MLLRMRGVPRKTKIDPDTGYLHVVNGDDPVASQWFDSVKLTSEYHNSFIFFFMLSQSI